jgi:hypothetical protein
LELARTDDFGIHVGSTLASRMQRIFAGQIGAAYDRTDAGDFEVLFLPPSDSFGGLRILERQKENRHLDSFRGAPRSKVHINSSRRAYFIKNRNALFYVRDSGSAGRDSEFDGHPEV